MAERYLPTTDAGLQAFSLNFSQRIGDTPTAFGLTEAQATAYGTAQSDFSNALANATNPATRGGATILAKNTARAALIPLTRQLVAIVQAFPGTTDAMRFDLGITIRKTPVPIPAPDQAPRLDLVSVNGRRVIVRIHNATQPTKRGKPPTILASSIYTFVGETYPSDPTPWAFQGQTTRDTFEIDFPDSVAAGSQVWITATWLNAKTETGPLAQPITTFVQFGVSQSSASLKIAA